MMPLALILIAVSLMDWLALLPDTAAGRSRLLLIGAVFSALAAALAYAVYGAPGVALVTFLTVFLGGLAWTGLRDAQDKGWVAIAALAAMLAVGAFVLPVLVPADPLANSVPLQFLAAYLADLPWNRSERLNPELVLLILGLLLFLGPTANAVVKTVMTQIRSFDYNASEQQLKGGRYIGPLERWLIFGLALAGQPTAAALVVSAKSIIRFPELQSKAGRPEALAPVDGDDARPREQKIDELTEYFLIGSLLSWLLALVAALPLTATRFLE